MNKNPQEVIDLLDADLTRAAIKSRSQAGTTLSYVDTYYVIKRLNECFGNLGWDSETVEMQLVSNPGEKAAYRAKVRITATVKTDDFEKTGGYMRVVKEGTGWGSDKSMNNAHEMASKEAESDALKRAAMKFGMSLGLALYDKSQENVEDAPKSAPKAAAQTAKPAPTQTVAPKLPVDQAIAASNAAFDRDAVNKKITAMSNVILAKAGPSGAPERTAKAAELKALVASKGAETKEALTDAKAAELLKTLEEMANT